MSTPIATSSDEPEPANAMCLPDTRWLHCNIKSISLMANVLAKNEAASQGKSEALMIRDGLLTEGAASNIFVVQQGVILTPPKSSWLLPGITRDLILELAQQHNLPWREQNIPQAELYDAEEIWLTSSAREIIPVVMLDDRPIGNGQPGPVWRAMLGFYRQYKANLADQA